MANPLTATRLLTSLRAEGLSVTEVGDWRTHNRNQKGAWGPVNGVMIHHTVTSGSERTVQICREGYGSLPGPLCHGVITKDGRVYLVGHGRANHAGLGDSDVMSAVVAEKDTPSPTKQDADGNARFYGFECENLGDGEDPWPDEQLDAIERASAALCRAHGWGERSVIGHMEWTNQKVDPRGFTMGSMRRRIANRLRVKPGAGPAAPLHHQVESGETLASIGRRYDVPWQLIAETNRMRSPYRVYPGNELTIPRASRGDA